MMSKFDLRGIHTLRHMRTYMRVSRKKEIDTSIRATIYGSRRLDKLVLTQVFCSQHYVLSYERGHTVQHVRFYLFYPWM